MSGPGRSGGPGRRAKPASAIRVSELNLAGEEGTALEMPVKVHLENPFLGSGCYVGSSGTPLVWKLITGTTSPPGPSTPIKGSPGVAELFEGGHIVVESAKLLELENVAGRVLDRTERAGMVDGGR